VFPGIYEFKWDAGHIIFLGIFYLVLATVAFTIVKALIQTIRDFRSHRIEAVRWHSDFEDLPAKNRPCRHELTGEIAQRTCPNAFDCRHCSVHPQFVAMREVSGSPRMEANDGFVAGFRLPDDRLYHRGHTWVREAEDGTLLIGLDDFGVHLLGTPDDVELPNVGARLVANGTGWHLTRKGTRVRVLAPIDGEVVATGGTDDEWVLKVRPDSTAADVRHLLSPAEARPWMLREVERLQMALSTDGVGMSLADGGMPVEDLSDAMAPDQFDEVCGAAFLEP
jgi:glycine cleavage system H lipoate-binding protein